MTTMKDINKKFTEAIMEFVDKGYTFNASTMGGSQGEVARADLTDGSDIVRVYVKRFFDKEELYLRGLEIVTGRDIEDAMPNGPHDWGKSGTIWNDCLEVINSVRFYTIWERGSYCEIFGTKEEAVEAYKKRLERLDNREEPVKVRAFRSEKAIEAVVPAIRRELGVTRVIRNKVRVVKESRRNGGSTYRVLYGDRDFALR